MPLSNSNQKARGEEKCMKDRERATYRNLLPQKFQVLLAVGETGLRGAQLFCQQLCGFVNGVCEHDVSAEPEEDFLCVLWLNCGARVEGVVEFEGGFERGVGAGLWGGVGCECYLMEHTSWDLRREGRIE